MAGVPIIECQKCPNNRATHRVFYPEVVSRYETPADVFLRGYHSIQADGTYLRQFYLCRWCLGPHRANTQREGFHVLIKGIQIDEVVPAFVTEIRAERDAKRAKAKIKADETMAKHVPCLTPWPYCPYTTAPPRLFCRSCFRRMYASGRVRAIGRFIHRPDRVPDITAPLPAFVTEVVPTDMHYLRKARAKFPYVKARTLQRNWRREWLES